MTTSFAPRTTNMLTVTELLELFDKMTAYGIDTHSREELAKVDPLHLHKHVTDAKTAQRMVDDYITTQYTNRYGRAPKTEEQRDRIVRCDGFLHDATFNRRDILTMLDDPSIRNILAQEFHERTVLMQGVYIPKIVADTHPIHPANKVEEESYL